ncbi:DUF4252 domain-containing protein [Phaeodactylibacter luteus]|uniref:DUF4252 domain-containing protein n=1 Tax=Phaeodactylibacter luteus TaxID=1564516 RepID=A0A5C6RRN4_9BACT|nr:DUF4252 domain-containing protein [Phaeodactylibacter luteus]TXB64933.1 DUF4252 domain-containing protein [Phaeodactylibacter luteus]
MRTLIWIAALCSTATFLPAQEQFISEFYERYNQLDEATEVDVQGWLLKLVAEKAENENTRKVVQKITHLRVLAMSEGNLVPAAEYRQLVRDLKRTSFEELFSARDEGDDISFFIREDQKRITHVMLLLHGKDNFVMLSLEGSLDFSDLNDLDLDIEGMEHFRKLPESKNSTPRA